MKKFSYGILTISLIVLLGSCSAFNFPESSRFKDGRVFVSAAHDKNDQIILLKKDTKIFYSVVEVNGTTFTYNKFVIKEINIETEQAEDKYELRSSNEDLLKAYLKNSKIHLFSSLKTDDRIFIIQRIIDTKDFNNVITRIVFSVASIDELTDEKLEDVKMPEKDITFKHYTKDAESIYTPLINVSPDTSKISIVGFIKQLDSNFDMYSTTIDLVNNKIVSYEKPYTCLFVKSIMFNSLFGLSLVDGWSNSQGEKNDKTTIFSSKEVTMFKDELNIFDGCGNNVLSKGLVTNEGNSITVLNFWDKNGIKSFNFVEMYNGEINEIQTELWGMLKTLIVEDAYLKDYVIIPKSKGVYEFIGLFSQENKILSFNKNIIPTSLIKIELDFNNKQVLKKNYIIFDDDFIKKYNDDDKLKFNNISSAYYNPNGDLIVGFEEINFEEFTHTVTKSKMSKLMAKNESLFDKLSSTEEKKYAEGLKVKNLYIANLGNDFKCKWLFKDDDRKFSILYDLDMEDVKATFYSDSKNVKFEYLSTKDGIKLVENELNVQTGETIKKTDLIESRVPFRTGQKIVMDKKNTIYGEDKYVLIFSE